MKRHIHHLHIIILIGLILLISIFVFLNIYYEKIVSSQKITFGVSFSPDYAKQLGLDPHKTYLSILEQLKVKNIRFSANWDEIELQKDKFNFTELEYYLDQAKQHNARVILAVGYKLPRWPECRAPSWVGSNLRERQLIMVEKVIRRFDQNPNISGFQIENEPYLEFGHCPKPDREFFKKEIELVRTLTHKPIIVTDTGELRVWRSPMQFSDIFGTTVYRKLYNQRFGDLYYPFPAWFYRVKSDLIRKIFAQQNQKTIISELQAEIWADQEIQTIPVADQVKRFSLDEFKNNVHFAKRSGFDEIYLWGVEWWYYLAQNGHPEYLEYAKELFRGS